MKNNNWYPWVVVGLLWVVALLNYMDRQMLSTMQEAMKIDISELNKAEAFGALMAVFLWIYGFMSPISGMIADRLNRKWLIVGSLFVWSTVTYLMGYADSFQELYWLTLNPQLHSRSATYKRNGLLIRKTAIKSSRPFQCAYYPLTP